MPAYDFRCRTCDTTFELRRPLADVPRQPQCPQGHPDTTRLFSAVAVGGVASRGASGAPAPAAPGGGGGGCCGGGCCG